MHSTVGCRGTRASQASGGERAGRRSCSRTAGEVPLFGGAFSRACQHGRALSGEDANLEPAFASRSNPLKDESTGAGAKTARRNRTRSYRLKVALEGLDSCLPERAISKPFPPGSGDELGSEERSPPVAGLLPRRGSTHEARHHSSFDRAQTGARENAGDGEPHRHRARQAVEEAVMQKPGVGRSRCGRRPDTGCAMRHDRGGPPRSAYEATPLRRAPAGQVAFGTLPVLNQAGRTVRGIAAFAGCVDQPVMMSVKERERLLSAYRDHARRFDAIAKQRARRAGIRSATARPAPPRSAASSTNRARRD